MIKFSHVTKTYRTNVGLEDVSVDIEKGDFVFLVGPSGAGKSTFIKLILKEIDADEGSILVDDREVTQLSNREIPELRRMIGTVFQDFRLLPKKTVFENVAFAMEVLHKSKRQIRKQVPQILSLVGITDKADKYPDELSAGEQQRVAIARAIINNPMVLIADHSVGDNGSSRTDKHERNHHRDGDSRQGYSRQNEEKSNSHREGSCDPRSGRQLHI